MNRGNIITSDSKQNTQNLSFPFLRIPRELITNPQFRSISIEAKLLYALLLDRLSLYICNGWHDETGRVFIYYTLDEIREKLQCGYDKAIKCLNELDIKKGAGLIEQVNQGQGKPARIYVMQPAALGIKTILQEVS